MSTKRITMTGGGKFWMWRYILKSIMIKTKAERIENYARRCLIIYAESLKECCRWKVTQMYILIFIQLRIHTTADASRRLSIYTNIWHIAIITDMLADVQTYKRR